MKRTSPFFVAFSAIVATVASAAAVDSPFAMCSLLEARIAAGDGITLPDADRELVRFAGTADFAEGDWPAEFLARAGQAVRVAVSPVTGCYEFFDESGAVFWTVVPVLPTTDNWVAPFRHAEEGSFPGDDLYAPWRLVDVWFLSHAESAENAELSLDFEFVNNGGHLRFVDNPDITNLCFTSFSFTETNLYFTAAWPTNNVLPEATLDLYGSTNLSTCWMSLSSHPATTNPVSFSVERDSLPWYVAPTQHVHDASCVSVTNIVASPLDGTTVYTNTFWSCSTNRAPGEAGFFRLGTRHDTDGDGLFDAAELLVHGTRPDRLDSDGDGIPDGVSPAEWYANPLLATNYLDADFVVELVGPHDLGSQIVLRVDGTAFPLVPDGGPWMFSLPPGEIVSCSLSADPFATLWCSPSEPPFWSRGLENVYGYHTNGSCGSCEIAVPVLTVEPDFGEPLRSGLSPPPSRSHLTGAGSVCVHGDEVLQRYSWSVAPAALGFGRQPVVTGAVRLEDGCPVIDIAGTTGERTGTFGFGPGYDSSGGLLWGELSAPLSAHRCDATPASPHCSVCGCYQPLDAFLAVSNTVLTLKHDNQTRIEIAHPYSWGESFEEGTVEIRRAGGNNEWMTLGTESELNPWTARIAGHFELRGISSVDGTVFTTDVVQVEVRFPTVQQIAADQNVIDMAETVWFFTLAASEPVPHNLQEYSFAIRLNTTNDTYVCDFPEEGPTLRPGETAWTIVDIDPYNSPESPAATDPGAVYLVAGFHTHPPVFYLPSYFDDAKVGPSDRDFKTALNQQIPGIVLDYIPTNSEKGTVPVGHPIDAETEFKFSIPPNRRPTP